jgi:UDP-N-acetylglucosamine acyltransferase
LMPAAPAGINSEGLKRRGYTPEVISAIRAAYKSLYRRGLTLEAAKAALREQQAQNADAAEAIGLMLTFLDTTTRGIVRP